MKYRCCVCNDYYHDEDGVVVFLTPDVDVKVCWACGDVIGKYFKLMLFQVAKKNEECGQK